jgi:hypothetical protein
MRKRNERLVSLTCTGFFFDFEDGFSFGFLAVVAIFEAFGFEVPALGV